MSAAFGVSLAGAEAPFPYWAPLRPGHLPLSPHHLAGVRQRTFWRAGSVEKLPVVAPERIRFLNPHNGCVRVRCIRAAGSDARYAGGDVRREKNPVKRDTAGLREVAQGVALVRPTENG